MSNFSRYFNQDSFNFSSNILVLILVNLTQLRQILHLYKVHIRTQHLHHQFILQGLLPLPLRLLRIVIKDLPIVCHLLMQYKHSPTNCQNTFKDQLLDYWRQVCELFDLLLDVLVFVGGEEVELVELFEGVFVFVEVQFGEGLGDDVQFVEGSEVF